jgi:hypothetical protein
VPFSAPGAKTADCVGASNKSSRAKLFADLNSRRAELEREHRTLQVAVRHQGADMPSLAKDVIEEFMQVALHYARHYAMEEKELDFSESEATQNKRDWKRNQFKGWARLAVAWAADLAPYQSPTYRAISISHKDEGQRDRGTTVLHTIEQVKEQLLLRGVSPEQFAQALLRKPAMLEHGDKDDGDDEPDR